MTLHKNCAIIRIEVSVYLLQFHTKSAIPLFRVVEVQRTCEATATPFREGANLSEISNNKRMRYESIGVRLWRAFSMHTGQKGEIYGKVLVYF